MTRVFTIVETYRVMLCGMLAYLHYLQYSICKLKRFTDVKLKLSSSNYILKKSGVTRILLQIVFRVYTSSTA